MVGGRGSMPRVKFAFSKDQLDAAPARTPTRTPTPTPTRGAIVNGVLALNPTSEIPDADRFTPMGNFGIVPVRTGIVRVRRALPFPSPSSTPSASGSRSVCRLSSRS